MSVSVRIALCLFSKDYAKMFNSLKYSIFLASTDLSSQFIQKIKDQTTLMNHEKKYQDS